MGKVILKGISKRFGDFQAVNGLDLEINQGEFISLLGPSGCGKTTTLRMLAGFIKSDTGSITIGDNVVDEGEKNLSPEHRNIGMVFQSYAVWPHMNVFKNIAYPLKLKKMPKDEIKVKVEDAMEMVGLVGLNDRMPNELSGGQQQRVALARALVMEPAVLLLDEPLSNLDAKLREKMRRDIRNIQRKEKLTIVFVTHDQEEAITMSDRIVVLNKGQVQQIGKPHEIYHNPANEFVAKFIGKSNVLDVTRTETGIITECNNAILVDNTTLKGDGKVCIRPEEFDFSEDGTPVVIKTKEFVGNRIEYVVSIGKHLLMVESRENGYNIGDTAKIKIRSAAVI